jgi:hypothetical protein
LLIGICLVRLASSLQKLGPTIAPTRVLPSGYGCVALGAAAAEKLVRSNQTR